MISYGITHVGKVREVNQDAYYNQDTAIGSLNNLFIVADGMGGHQGGEVASKMAVDAIMMYIEENSISALREKLKVDNNDTLVSELIFQGVSTANNKVYKKSVDEPSLFGMGTTVVVATIYNNKLIIGHVGDSRLYVLGDELSQITKDHSYVQELVDLGDITREEAINHPNKNQITRAVGVDKEVDIDIIEYDLRVEDSCVLICSDGLTGMLSEDEITSVLREESSVKDKTLKLQQKTLDNGAKDNVTAIIIER